MNNETGNNRKKVLIIGAGPAGLTAAYELLSRSDGYEVVVFEGSDMFGGISRTVNYKGNRMDMGGHRFFSKAPEVNEWWDNMLPRQGEPAKDDIILNRNVNNSYKNEEYFNINNLYNIDKFFIEAVVRQNKY